MTDAALIDVPVRDVSVRLKRITLAAASVAVALSVVGSAISPYLLTHHPVLLLLLGPEAHHVVLTTHLLPGWWIVSLTTVRRVVGLVALFWFGWAHGQSALIFIEKRFGRFGRILRWVERSLVRFGALIVVLIPLPVVAVLAGVAGLRFSSTLAALSLGQLFWVTATWAFGEQISEITGPIVEFLSTYVLEATLVCIALVGVWQLAAYLMRRRRLRRPSADS